jgi:hypothetical protein
LEIDPDNMLLKDWKSNATISMENGQFLISWMERLFRNNKTLLNGLVPGYKLPSQQLSLFHRTMSRLARKTGNISVAYQHLHFSGEVDTANEFRNFSRENTKNLRNGFTFCGQNLSTDFLNDHALIHILHAAKLVRKEASIKI